MNAAAYLHKQGWRGDGYSLDQTDRGLAKPLLISRQDDLAGLGKKKSYESTSNQWWLNAFDKSLKGLKTGSADSGERSITAVPTPNTTSFVLDTPRTQGTNLYSSFIKAETLKSTIDFEPAPSRDKMSKTNGKADKESSKSKKKESSKRKHVEKDIDIPSLEAPEPVEVPMAKKSKKSKPDKTKGHSEEHQSATDSVEASAKAEKNKKKKSKPGETNGHITEESPAVDLSETTVKMEKKKSKKRRHEEDDDVDEANELKRSKRAKPDTAENTLDKVEELRKTPPEEIREERKKDKREKHAENARQKVAHEAEEEAAKGADVGMPKAESEPEQPKQAGPPHAESIAGLRARGVFVDVPWVAMPPKDSRGWDYATFLTEQQRRVDEVITRNRGEVYKPDEQEVKLPEDFNPKSAGKKSYKADKYEREKAKRVAKRLAKHWQDVREHPENYRPDGTSLTAKDRGVTREELKAKRVAEKEEKRRLRAEKDAKHAIKEQMKVERRAAKKLARSERKRRNHEMMQAHISAKIQKQKLEKQQAEADARGMTLEAYQADQEARLAQRRLERDTAKAEALGITVEQLEAQRARHMDEKEMAKEASQLGLGIDEYMNQMAEVRDEDIEPSDDPALVSGMGKAFGRSGFDKVWMRWKAKKEAEAEAKADAKAEGAISAQDTKPSGDNSEDSDSNSDSGPGEEAKPVQPPPSTNGTKAPATRSEDFIPLFDGPQLKTNKEMMGFSIDSAGDKKLAPDPNAPKKVKDMTKAERKARLEAIRAKRAEKAANKGKGTLSKKERRKRRAEQKEEVILNMTNDLLALRKRQRNSGQEVGPVAGTGGGKGADIARKNAVNHGELIPGSKGERKEARREARRIMRGMKKGRIPEHEIPPGWEKYAPTDKKPKLKGNGGREPKRASEKDVWYRT